MFNNFIKTLITSAIYLGIFLQYGCNSTQVKSIPEDNPAERKKADSFKPSKQYAKLYIGRESAFAGGGGAIDIKLADRRLMQYSELVGLYNDEYFYLELEPADYVITYSVSLLGSVRNERKTHYKALPGKIDYLYCDVSTYLNVGFWTVDGNEISNCKVKAMDAIAQNIFKNADLIKAPNIIVKRKPKKQIIKQNIDDDYSAWRKADERGTIGAYLAFTKKYPKSTFVKLARNKIKQLQSFK